MATNDHAEATVTVPYEGDIPTSPAAFADWAWDQINNCRTDNPKVLKAAFEAAVEADTAAYEQAYDEEVRSGELNRALTAHPKANNGMLRSRYMMVANILTENVEHGDEAQTAFVKRLLGIEDPAEVEEVEDDDAPEGDALVETVAALETAEQDVDAIRAERDRLIREAHAAGARQTDLAKIAGVSQQAIAKIIKTAPQPAPVQASVTEAWIETVDGKTYRGATLREVLDTKWGKLAKIGAEFGRLAVTVPLDGGVAKLAEIRSYEVSDADRLRAWERKHRMIGEGLAEGEVQAARARFTMDGTLPEDAPDASELWLIQ